MRGKEPENSISVQESKNKCCFELKPMTQFSRGREGRGGKVDLGL